MYVKISEQEYQALKSALTVRLAQMREELIHTDDRAYRIELRADLEALEEFEKRLLHSYRMHELKAAA